MAFLKKTLFSGLHFSLKMGDCLQEYPICQVQKKRNPFPHADCFVQHRIHVPKDTDRKHSILHRTDTISSYPSDFVNNT